METARQPATIISTANTVGLIGVTVYFYKQMTAMQVSIGKITEHLTTVIKQLESMKNSSQQVQQIGAVVSELNNGLNQVKNLVNNMPSAEDIDIMGEDIDNVIQTLEDSGLSVDRGASRTRSGRGSHQNRKELYDRRQPSRPVNRLINRNGRNNEVSSKEMDDVDDEKRDIDLVRRARQRR